jgi:bacteriocin biosynthesis cyclodehydratase domain-containing protein
MGHLTLKSTDRIRAAPFNIRHSGDGTILTRGNTSIRVSGELARSVVDCVLATRHRIVRIDDILAQFNTEDRLSIEEFLEHLLQKRLLVKEDEAELLVDGATESPAAVFYWDFGLNAADVLNKIRTVRIEVVGVNSLSQAVASQLHRIGFEQFASPTIEIGDRPENNFTAGKPDLVVAATDLDGQASLLPWNAYCIEEQIEFLPVMLESTRGTIGPWVVPGQTACLNCMRSRQNSNLNDYLSTRAAQSVPYNGSHPALAEVVGSLAGWEIAKRFTGLPGWKAGICVTFRSLECRLTSHRVLRIARCEHCSRRNSQAPVNIEEYEFAAGER